LLKVLYQKAIKIIKAINKAHIGAFAAQSAFFMILSFLPLAELVSCFLRLSGVEFDLLGKLIMPYDYDVSLTGVISFGTLFVAWSAGRAFHALSEGFQSVLAFASPSGYFKKRLRSLVLSVAFAALISMLTIIGLFGNNMFLIFTKAFPGLFKYYFLLNIIKTLFLPAVLFVIITFLYRLLPNWETDGKRRRNPIKLKHTLVSSLGSSGVICVFTFGFSVYITNFTNYRAVYGAMASLVCVMLWLYGTMYAVIIGFGLSVFLSRNNHSLGR